MKMLSWKPEKGCYEEGIAFRNNKKAWNILMLARKEEISSYYGLIEYFLDNDMQAEFKIVSGKMAYFFVSYFRGDLR